MIMGRTESTLKAKREQIAAAVGPEAQVHTFVGDAVDPVALSEALAQAEALTGRLGIAVSVVGGGTMKPLLMFDAEDVADDLEAQHHLGFPGDQARDASDDQGRRRLDRLHLLRRRQDSVAVPGDVQHVEGRRRRSGQRGGARARAAEDPDQRGPPRPSADRGHEDRAFRQRGGDGGLPRREAARPHRRAGRHRQRPCATWPDRSRRG